MANINSNVKLITSDTTPTTSNLPSGNMAFGNVGGTAKLFGNIGSQVVEFTGGTGDNVIYFVNEDELNTFLQGESVPSGEWYAAVAEDINTTVAPKCHIEFRDDTAEELDLSWLRTDEIEDFSYMFTGVPNLKSVDLSKFNTSKAKNMSNMFYGCNNLKNIDLSTFDTSLVTDMSEMFHPGFDGVFEKHIDFRNADFSKVATVGRGIFIDKRAIIAGSSDKMIDVIVKDDEQKAKLAILLNKNEQDMVTIRTVAEL